MKKIKAIIPAFLLISIILIISCSTDPMRGSVKTSGKAGLVLKLRQSDVAGRTILPDISMEIARYDIRGFGPSGEHFERYDWPVQTALELSSVTPGQWTIEVDGKNIEGTVIGYGQTVATLTAGVTNSVTVTVRPVTGEGNLIVIISWSALDFDAPSVTGYVEDALNDQKNLGAFNVSNNSATSITTLDNGYYSLSLDITDGANTASLRGETLRIVQGCTTTANLEVDGSGGMGLVITIVQELDDPIQVAFSGLIFELPEGDDMTLTASTAPSPVDSYQWYIDGNAVSGAESNILTFGSALAPGRHQVVLVVKKGTTLSSGKLTFYVMEAEKVFAKGFDKRIDLRWIPPNDNVTGYDIYRSSTSDGSYVKINYDRRNISVYSDWLNQNNRTYFYKIRAVSPGGEYFIYNDKIVSASSKALNDEEFLSSVQEPIFRYFYDFGHPVSGLARERYPFEETCTTGGTGFGLMAIIVGVERGFVERDDAAKQVLKTLDFLKTECTRYHGAWSHWINGATGQSMQFLPGIYAGDLIETAFLVQGMLCLHQYFDGSGETESRIRDLVKELWESVEWDFYRGEGWNQWDLWWHWSPDQGWNWPGNFHIEGYNEGMIAYLLAIASPTHGIPVECYSNGWAEGAKIGHEYYASGEPWNTYYGIKQYLLPFKSREMGMPLFWTHYSFLGFDPRGKNDGIIETGVTYYDVFRNISLIDRAYCQSDGGYNVYGPHIWGLTASDDPWGYGAHSPHEDNGTITPSAFISAMPYVPEYSIPAMRYVYDTYTWQVWGEFGFKDAFNLSRGWFSNLYLAIDQGPNIVMIENHRTGLLWDLFMSHPDIQTLVTRLQNSGWTIQ